MKKVLLKDVKKGDYFRLTNSETAPVWVKSDYDRFTKTYEIYKFDDVCHCAYRKGSTYVYIDFEF